MLALLALTAAVAACGPGDTSAPAAQPLPVETPVVQAPPPPDPEPALPELVLSGRWLPAESGRLLVATATAQTDGGLRVVTAEAEPSSSDGSFEIVLRGDVLSAPGRVDVREASLDGTPGDRFVVLFRETLTGREQLGKLGSGGEPPVLATGTLVRVDGPTTTDHDYDHGETVWTQSQTVVPVANSSVRLMAHALGAECEIGRVVTSGDGGFEICGKVAGAERLWLEALGSWTHAATTDVTEGAEDVQVEVALTCSLAGSLAEGHGFDVEDLEICVRGEGITGEWDGIDVLLGGGGWSREDGRISFPLKPPGDFTLCGLPPGTYHVTLRVEGSREVLETMNDIDVRGRETRLPPLLVGRDVGRTEARVSVPEGVARDEVRVWSRAVSAGGAFREEAVEDGVAVIGGSGRLLEVAAHAPGCRYAVVQSEDAVVEIALEEIPATPVEVPLPPGVVREADGVEILLTVRWRETLDGERLGGFKHPGPGSRGVLGDPRDAEDHEIPLPAEGPVRLELTEPGVYRIGCRVRAGRDSTEFQGAASVRIDGSGTPVTARRPFATGSVNRRVEQMSDAE